MSVLQALNKWASLLSISFAYWYWESPTEYHLNLSMEINSKQNKTKQNQSTICVMNIIFGFRRKKSTNFAHTIVLNISEFLKNDMDVFVMRYQEITIILTTEKTLTQAYNSYTKNRNQRNTEIALNKYEGPEWIKQCAIKQHNIARGIRIRDFFLVILATIIMMFHPFRIICIGIGFIFNVPLCAASIYDDFFENYGLLLHY